MATKLRVDLTPLSSFQLILFTQEIVVLRNNWLQYGSIALHCGFAMSSRCSRVSRLSLFNEYVNVTFDVKSLLLFAVFLNYCLRVNGCRFFPLTDVDFFASVKVVTVLLRLKLTLLDVSRCQFFVKM